MVKRCDLKAPNGGINQDPPFYTLSVWGEFESLRGLGFRVFFFFFLGGGLKVVSKFEGFWIGLWFGNSDVMAAGSLGLMA